MECCGAEGPMDWQRSVYNKKRNFKALEIGIPKSQGGNSRELSGDFDIPKSCCKDPNTQECREIIRNINASKIKSNVIYQDVSLYLLNKQSLLNCHILNRIQ